jgi:hypothetical protein
VAESYRPAKLTRAFPFDGKSRLSVEARVRVIAHDEPDGATPLINIKLASQLWVQLASESKTEFSVWTTGAGQYGLVARANWALGEWHHVSVVAMNQTSLSTFDTSFDGVPQPQATRAALMDVNTKSVDVGLSAPGECGLRRFWTWRREYARRDARAGSR